MSPRYVETRPAHELVAASLRAQIMCGDIKPGAPLPTTAKLADQYDVSPTTIQRVQRTLEAEGFLYGVNGKGVYVRQAQPIVIKAAAYIEPKEGEYSYTLIDASEAIPPADARGLLGLEDDGVAVLRHRMMLFADVPAEVSWSYYPVDFARGTVLTAKRKIARGGAYRVLRELGLSWGEPVDVLSWRPATADEAEQLELPPGIPILRTLRVIRTPEGSPVEVSVLVKSGHLYSLEYGVPSH